MAVPLRSHLMLSLFAAAPFLALTWWNIWVPYSYWLDELFSVLSSAGSWAEIISAVLRDVHPPLYQPLLKLWIDIFGTSEPATRSLSALFATGAMGAFVFGFRHRSGAFVVSSVVILGSSWLFAYYGQETRAYALLLLASAVALVLFLNRENNPGGKEGRFIWYAVLVVLSLTHYFGLIFAGVLLTFDTFRAWQWGNVLERVGVGLIILAWPVIHLVFGDIGDKAGGSFWIQSDGIHDSLMTAYAALFPAVKRALFSAYLAAKWAHVLFLLSVIIITVWWFRISEGPARMRLTQLVGILVVFVAAVAAIDLHSPISTERNYIVLVPLVAVIGSTMFQGFWEHYKRLFPRLMIGAALLSYGAASAAVSVERIETKWGPVQNWSGLAQEVHELGICHPHCWFLDVGWHGRWRYYEHYFGRAMGSDPRSVTIDITLLEEAIEEVPVPVIGAHIGRGSIDAIKLQMPHLQCWQPVQSSRKSVVLLIDVLEGQHDLVPCD